MVTPRFSSAPIRHRLTPRPGAIHAHATGAAADANDATGAEPTRTCPTARRFNLVVSDSNGDHETVEDDNLDLADFYGQNGESLDAVDRRLIAELKVGEGYWMGGGAAPRFCVRRVA